MSEKDEYLVSGRTLIFDDYGISWKNKILNNRIIKPIDLRYSALPLQFDFFNIGTRFLIELRDERKNRLKISFRTYFGINYQKKVDLYHGLLDKIWEEFFEEEIKKHIEFIEGGNQIQLGNYLIDIEGIKYKKSSFKFKFIESQLVVKRDQVLLTSNSNSNQFSKLDYRYDWNWSLIQVIFEYFQNASCKSDQ